MTAAISEAIARCHTLEMRLSEEARHLAYSEAEDTIALQFGDIERIPPLAHYRILLRALERFAFEVAA